MLFVNVQLHDAHNKNTREIAEERIIVVLLIVSQPSADGTNRTKCASTTHTNESCGDVSQSNDAGKVKA